MKVNFIDGHEPGCCARISNWILGLEADVADEEKHHKEMEEHVQKLSTLSQTTTQKVVHKILYWSAPMSSVTFTGIALHLTFMFFWEKQTGVPRLIFNKCIFWDDSAEKPLLQKI